jgi:long-chain acyl-CoA synthetase
MTAYSERIARADTFPKLLRLNAREYPKDIAYREKDFGIWRAFTWAEYQVRARDFALGLLDLGLARGDVVTLIGDNRPDWIAGEIAAHAVGAISLGLYRDALDEEVAHLLALTEPVVAFAEDEEQVDKLLGVAERAPSLRHIVYSDPRGIRKYADPRLLSADELARRGATARPTTPQGTSPLRRAALRCPGSPPAARARHAPVA